MSGAAAAGRDEREHARTHFDRFAGLYGRVRWIQRAQHEALAELELRADDDFLDVGCGAGVAVAEAAAVVRRAAGADLSAEMIERARAAAPDAELHVADAADLPFADGEFSALMSSTSAHHYPDARAALAEFARVVRPGGRVVVADMSRDRLSMRVVDALSRRFERGHVGILSRAELEEGIRAAGLEPAGVRTLWGGRYFVARAVKPA